MVKNLPANAGDLREVGLNHGSGRPPEEEVATHFGILAWRIPWTEEPWRATAHRAAKCQARLQ